MAIDEEDVHLVLEADEALVLFEFLSRFSDDDELSTQHEAETHALWNLQCLLEKKLVAPFRDDYDEILDEARNSLIVKGGHIT